jgi:antitoxin component YwqK of YwqJK toxin-antitoxin module
MKTIKTSFFIFIFALFSCGDTVENNENNLPSICPSVNVLVDKNTEIQKNILDSNNQKQGVWDIVKNNKIQGFQTYKNDTLNGPYRKSPTNYPGQIEIGNFLSGLENGPIKYYEKDTQLSSVINFRLGKKLWMGFLGNSSYPKPPKGFLIFVDSIFVECPYSNDTIWYKGLFLNKKPVGIHKMFYENGHLKFEYNYSNKKIKVFDRSGKLMKEVIDDNGFNLNIIK